LTALSSKKSFWWPIALLVASALVGALSWQQKRTPDVDKSIVYRIGYGNDVPFHFKEDDGEPSGLAFDLVNEAALRTGIELKWIQSEKFEQANQDLWVLMTIRPDRLAGNHFTEPYLQSRSCFLVQEHSPFHNVSDLVNARISHVDYGIHRERLAANLPTSETVRTESSRDAVSALLEGKSDAVYLDQYAALRAVLEGQLATSVRVINSHFSPLELALVSTFQAADVADTIRGGMKTMVRDGSVNEVIGRWNLFPNLTDNMVEGLVNAERRIRILAFALICSILALSLLLWLALRLRRQTLRLEKVQESLRQSAEHYRAIVENTNDIVYSVDGQGTIKFLSPQATRYGIDPKAAVSRNMLDFIADEDRERVEKEFRKTMTTGIAHATEFRLPRTDSPPRLARRTWEPRTRQGREHQRHHRCASRYHRSKAN
jgi:ABC-type amino acid transport substrate-binding protein